MPNPFFLMAVLSMVLAILAALDSSLSSLQLIPVASGLTWLRIHFITLGALAQVAFGAVPELVALRTGRPRPAVDWDTWFSLNVGLIVLAIGIPLFSMAMVYVGGALVFWATLLLLYRLWSMRPVARENGPHSGRPFYIMALVYLLVGIVVGTGIFFGWGDALHIAAPVEVHIHANIWGFTSLLFAGLLVDLYPRFAGRPFAWPRSVRPIFWLMVVGAFGLVFGPWIQVMLLLAPGLLLYLTATIWLLLNMIVPWVRGRAAWTPGLLHLVTSYLWILAPVVAAPVVLLSAPDFLGGGIEHKAPQALVYGWALQFGYGMLPYLFRRWFLQRVPATLGGNWFSLIAMHVGCILLWASIFVTAYSDTLYGAAYGLWLLSALPIAREFWTILRVGLVSLEQHAPAEPEDEPVSVPTPQRSAV